MCDNSVFGHRECDGIASLDSFEVSAMSDDGLPVDFCPVPPKRSLSRSVTIGDRRVEKTGIPDEIHISKTRKFSGPTDLLLEEAEPTLVVGRPAPPPACPDNCFYEKTPVSGCILFPVPDGTQGPDASGLPSGNEGRESASDTPRAQANQWDGQPVCIYCDLLEVSRNAEIKSLIFPGTGNDAWMMGLEDKIRSTKPFKDPESPSFCELMVWNEATINHARRLVGNFQSIALNERLSNESLWQLEKSYGAFTPTSEFNAYDETPFIPSTAIQETNYVGTPSDVRFADLEIIPPAPVVPMVPSEIRSIGYPFNVSWQNTEPNFPNPPWVEPSNTDRILSKSWDGIPITSACGKTKNELLALLFKGNWLKGGEDLYLNTLPFADTAFPTMEELVQWYEVVFNHLRALLGIVAPLELDLRLMYEAQWGNERSHGFYQVNESDWYIHGNKFIPSLFDQETYYPGVPTKSITPQDVSTNILNLTRMMVWEAIPWWRHPIDFLRTTLASTEAQNPLLLSEILGYPKFGIHIIQYETSDAYDILRLTFSGTKVPIC